MSCTQTKVELRQLIRQQLRSLSPEDEMRWSAEVIRKVEQHEAFVKASTVLLYHALPHEVDTQPLLERWYKKKQLLLPVVVGDELELRIYTGADCMQAGRFGIMEPQGRAFRLYDDISLVLVPGLSFDAYGGRLGRGRGYYDRLLPRLPHARRIALCFPCQLIAQVPTESHDIRMDEVICR